MLPVLVVSDALGEHFSPTLELRRHRSAGCGALPLGTPVAVSPDAQGVMTEDCE